ncbi:hypothetical protein ND925_12650 [Vibrio diabolicus]|jgi:hypothetical protein|uniref:hypothetical protein n=1 Tax=Vibrio TaxID=662 RepID=UPI001A28B185|nr:MULTISPECIES: hypothetical protein [Vibrio]EGQ7904717.1 hypothetical protein [Vibrio alginolyticus]EKM3679351.1 hypothetical protein [Vibrio alginolyticus]ELB2852155.1 hypothetical protein [Vibrio alginolyticus]MCR9550401.1 hypothetical protein [Vibrio sp. RM-41-2A]MCR9555971.1 hypothetical protein [Vibrio sp. RM-41-2B]
MNPYMQLAKRATNNFMNKPWLQGWQWAVEIDSPDAPTDFDIYVKDIDFGAGSIDADSFQVGSGSIALPTYSSVGEITLTVRDDQNLTISKWFESRIKKVRNQDGTLNIPKEYVFKINIFTLNEDGKKSLYKSYQVFPTKIGNVMFSRENGNQIQSFPLILQKFMSVGNKVL